MESQFEKLIDPNKYQVFLFTCPAHVPVNMFVHPWFVVNMKGVLSRWEVCYLSSGTQGLRHLYIDHAPPFQGIEVFSFSKKYFWNATLIGTIEGGENSLAKKVADHILRTRESYPYRDRYFLFGPNSDTYAQWVLDRFPEWNVKLPRNTIGKKYGNKK